MSEKNTSISKEKILSFSSALGIIALCWGLYTGVFDRGTSSGAFNEKVIYFERSMLKNEASVEAVAKELKELAAAGTSTRIDLIKLQALYEQLANETRENRKILEDIRDRQLRGPN